MAQSAFSDRIIGDRMAQRFSSFDGEGRLKDNERAQSVGDGGLQAGGRLDMSRKGSCSELQAESGLEG